MAFREFLHHELGAALGLHHEDPVVQNLAGLRRVGAAVYGLEDELKAKEAQAPAAATQRARCYFAAATAMVTFADSFVVDAFLDPDHPKHVAHVTYLQARQFYLRIPDLVTAVRKELAYPNSATETLPVLCGPRIEVGGRCPVEHLLAMKRAAGKVEEVIGTRVGLVQAQGGEAAERAKTAVLMMTEAKTKRESADQVIGAIRAGERVPQASHEDAEALYYDGVLRVYLYAAQELELPGVAKKAPETENEPEPEEDQQEVWARRRQPAGLFMGPGATGPGMGMGQLIAADVIGNLASGLIGGLFGGGYGGGNWW